jgi:electron transport complex protein RnfC
MEAAGTTPPAATTNTAPAAPPPLVPLPARLMVPIPPTAQRATDHKPVGTRVSRGEPLMITTAGAAHVPLAPADGVIAGVEEVQLLDARRVTALRIDVDSPGSTSAESPPSAPPHEPHPSGAPPLPPFIERLRLAGIWAERHSSPDLLAQLHEAIRRPVDTLVCNLIDVDGGSTLNAKLVREHGTTLVAGALAAAKAAGVNRVYLATDPRLADRTSVFVRKAGAGTRIKVVPLVNDYPQANPTLLLYALTGRRLRPDNLPPEVGAMVIDGAAAVAIGRCVETSEPMLVVPVEVRDSARARSLVTRAVVGTPLRAVLEALKLNGPFTLRAGAALRDVKVCADAIVAGTELTIDAGPIAAPINPDPCIRSGWCVENCPVRINPAGILEAAQDNNPALAEHFGLHACIECGICSYVCPSRLPLLDSIRVLRRTGG